jgi:cytochrome P450
MRDDRLGGLLRFNETTGDIGRFAFVFGSVVLVNTPELIHDVLVTKAKSFEKSPILRGSLHPLAGQGLFTSEGDLWRRQRKLMAPMFQHGALRHFAEDMTSCADRAARTWRDGQVVDMARETTRITMAIAGRTLFSEDLFGDADELGAALTTALDWAGVQSSSLTLIVQARVSIGLELVADRLPASLGARARALADRAIVPILWPGERTRTLQAALDLLESRVHGMIADRRGSKASPRDLLTLLLEAKDDDDGGVMTDKQVRDELLTLFVAGHETTATALAWSLMLLAQHPEIYVRVRAEVDAVGRVPTVDDLPRLGLCLRVFKEALRLYPPVYLFGRVAMADVEVGDYALPKGTVVLVSPFSLHRRPELWTDPERFDPDRFLPQEEARRHKTAFLPFSAGPRTCIGNTFALMEGPLVLATLLHHADIALCDPKGAEPEPSATLRPRGGIPMKLALRRGHSENGVAAGIA